MIDWFVAMIAAFALWLAANGFSPSHLVAGFLGSIARAVVAKSGTMAENLIGGFTGSLFAVYFTPIVAMALGVADPQIANAVAFSIGLVGMYIAEGCINWAKQYRKNPGKLKEDFRELVLRLISKK
ncbi:hypothetical protein [Mycoplana ramosa]|uniref:Holin n=1 Tax=Mycoplana ramosa TaxID=40837 RepID=A0ABW3YTS0_MYCRA